MDEARLCLLFFNNLSKPDELIMRAKKISCTAEAVQLNEYGCDNMACETGIQLLRYDKAAIICLQVMRVWV